MSDHSRSSKVDRVSPRRSTMFCAHTASSSFRVQLHSQAERAMPLKCLLEGINVFEKEI